MSSCRDQIRQQPKDDQISHAIAHPWADLHTMIVKAAPLFATILCRWLGRLAIPIGDALSTPGAIAVNMVGGSDAITMLRDPAWRS